MAHQSALIVEDLDEPRQWLMEVLPRALPSLLHVDAAATLQEAVRLMGTRRHDLAVVDWSLPDGTSRELIGALSKQGTTVVVATIHDDDSHVFPALQAGASGYVLKSQPRAVVEAQLRRIEQGEPPLSPSIAMRVLHHFRHDESTPGNSAQASLAEAEAEISLTQREIDILRLIGKGYKAVEIAKLLGITLNTVNTYVRDVYRKLGISSRAEAALEASRRGLVR
jgi:DNA-binding NarL/FixJ family response regulator